ncbi:MAG: 3-methylmercaptopropionyl-CoA ligase of DmdB2 type [uncultured Sphingomonadaceae bacterium]|uniref:3-methylmercaptopropionyl-CoA ligase n=1 Tax=uncultured Sphingomonadaceae bacterium TaxID=169976 RepID=A0A6J4TDL1_9SPHN|nr:MAG: 3-methylmercaptopropionyl-CoA ligase of DmdB2 type [uncultured Sphingomonadaceae bacterium]
MLGLMQDWPLTVDKIADHAARWHGEQRITSRLADGSITRQGFAETFARARRVSAALRSLGVGPGDRVATMAWNHAKHLETWYGTMGMGAVCHTLNPRLFTEQLSWIVNHAEDRAIVADAQFAPLLAKILPDCPTVRDVIFLDPAELPPIGDGLRVHRYDELVAAADPTGVIWGGFDERTAAGLCYTSGTTGNPKGVLYSHRSNFLHALMSLQADVFALSASDVALMVVPMFHANSWGLAFAAPAVGAKLVMPGAQLDGASLFELIEAEGVTFSAAVPTVWQGLLTYLRESGSRPTRLRKVAIGGSACPEALIRGFWDEYGVEVIHAWGMTELSPIGSASVIPLELQGQPYENTVPFRLTQGRPPIGVEMQLSDDENRDVPHDGRAVGRLKVRGFAVAASYMGGDGQAAWDEDGWFDTGDIASLAPDGTMRITDRAKDVIKSGGEWISSIEIENIAVGHPDVAVAAVIGMPHPKWDERPVLLIQPRPGCTVDAHGIRGHLEGRIAKWWMPDAVVAVESIPLGATGKIDKKALRADAERGRFGTLG